VFRRIRGVMVNTVEYGAGEVTVVGLAGVFGNVELWQQPFELLHRRFRTIAYDHLGTGETRVPSEQVTFDGQVALLGELLAAFDVDRCVLAGDSSLVSVAVAAAHRWPDRVEGLALVAGRIDHRPDDRTERFVAALRHDFERTLDGFVRLCLPEDDGGHLRRWLRDIIARTGPERSATLVESFYDVDVRPLLPEIGVPSIVVHGALDRVNELDAAHAFADALPAAELLILDGVGHVPTLSRPDVVAGAIADLMRR
jgi:pimeloyl-ACP methyl ester carboxylesterase